MYCNYCGKVIQDDANVCAYCGKRVTLNKWLFGSFHWCVSAKRRATREHEMDQWIERTRDEFLTRGH